MRSCLAVLIASLSVFLAGCSSELTCGPGTTKCEDVCVDVATDVANCGACGSACAPAHAEPACTAGVCGIASCATGYRDCDANAASGCETDVRTSVAHCGACGAACAPANATGACSAGVCGIASCATGFRNCDGSAANGCETDVRTSVAHCGACGAACAPPANAVANCTAGQCGLGTCNAGWGNCDGSAANGCETDVRTSVAHCGACGAACAPPNATGACAGGSCAVGTCAAAFGDCDGSAVNGCETDLRSSAAHCGACGVACAPANAAGVCTAGQCGLGACNAGWANCDGSPANGCETDLRVDSAHCGACGNACAQHTACSAGVCAGACAPGFGDCDGSPANGCETELVSSAAHCGACGNVCAPGATCQDGLCSNLAPAGLVGWWRLDGDASDASGFARHGTLVGGVAPAADRFSRPGSALQLDGSTGYADVAQGLATIDVGQAEYTVSGWFRSLDPSNVILPKQGLGQAVLNTHPHYGLCVNLNHDWAPGRMLWAVGNTADWFFATGGSQDRFVAGEWHFFTVVKKGPDYTFFLDGVVDAFNSWATAADISGAAGFRFGAIAYPGAEYLGSEYLPGSIDDYRIHDRALSPDEIRTLYAAGGFRKACPAPRRDCGGVCLDTSADPLNCGACGSVCGSMTVCEAGACRPFATVIDLRADVGVETGVDGKVTRWRDQSGNGFDATPAIGALDAPGLTTAVVNGRSHPVLRFGGANGLSAPPSVPPDGTLFIVLSNVAPPSDRNGVFEWGGQADGVAASPNYMWEGGTTLVVARKGGAAGDVYARPVIGIGEWEVWVASWGPAGTTLERRRANGDLLAASSSALRGVGSIVSPLSIAPTHEGDIAVLLVYDRQLSPVDRTAIATALHATWLAGP